MAVTDDAIWGAKRGLALGVFFCLWITLIYVLRGEEAFARKHVNYGTMVVCYLAIGLVAGSIVGALRRFAKSEGTSFLVGLAAGAPIAIGITLAVYGLPPSWPPSTRLFIPVYGLAAGWFIGNELNKARVERLKQEKA